MKIVMSRKNSGFMTRFQACLCPQSNLPGRVVLARASRTDRIGRYRGGQGLGKLTPPETQSPLRSRAVSLIPFLRPSVFTTCSSAGIVKLLRGETQMPDSTFGVSSSGLPVPTSASPLSTIGDAFSIRIW